MPKSKRPKKSSSKKRTQYGAPIHRRHPQFRGAIWVGVAALVVISALIYLYWNQPGGGKASTGTPATALQIVDEVAGAGQEAKAGMTASVHYTGWLKNGTKFDSSLDRAAPFQFLIGAGQVIPGWDQGILGMKVGGKRKLIIPPSLGYGSQRQGSIPPNSELTFEIQLLDLK